MKKLFALLAVVLAVASCQKNVDNLDVNVGGEQLVNITVGLPEATRVASDTGFDFANLGNNFELRYILEIYAEGNTTDCIRKEVFTKNQSVVFPVRLIHGRDYHVVAWADIVPANANRTAEGDYDYYYETSNGLTAVEIISWNAMDEYRDAFTTFADIENFSANRSLDLTLVRPFAKIRVVSTDIKDIEDLGLELGRGEVTYRYDMYRKFNAYTGTASDAASKAHTFTYPTVYAQSGDADETETQRTLYADYIFVDDVKNPDVVQFTMNVWDSNDVLIKETQFMTDIPVHANKLTTIIGEVLTEGGNVKITIDNGLAEQERVTVVSSASHLLKVINAGGEYIMGNNIIVTAKDVAEAQGIITRSTGEAKTTTINLNGYTITLQANVEVKEGNTLIIDNEPLNDNGGDKGAVINDNGAIVNNGTLVIEGGNYNEGAIQNNGTTNVNGGDFADGAINNNGNVTIEGDNSGRSDDIVNNDEEATLNKVVYNAEELQAALDAKNADEIIFGADIKGEATISQTAGVNVVIDGNRHKFDGTLYIHGNARHTGEETLTIKNIDFEANAAKYFIDSNETDTARRYAHNVTIQNCTFTSLADNNSVAVCGIRFRQAHNVNINGCTADNTFFLAWFTGCNNTTIENCRAINNYEGITLGNGTTTTIKGSSIDADLYGIRVESNLSNYSDTHNVTIDNCELNAFIPVSVRSLTTGKFNLALQGVNKLTRGGDYDIALCSNEYKEGVAAKAPTCEWAISGADNFIVFPREYAVKSVEEIAEALTLKSKVLFAADIEGNVYIPQQENFNVVIDGRGYKFDGGFIVDGQNRLNGAEKVLFKNINFYTESTDEMTFISCPSTYNGVNERYSHNVTIDGCTFRASTLTDKVGAISAQKTYHLTVKNCEAYNIHSLLQVQSCDNDVTVEKVKVENCFSGISVGNTKTTSISNANIKTQKYGIRLDGETSRKVTVNVANSNIEAYIPVVARKVTTGTNVDVNLTGTTLVNNNNDMLDVVFQNNKDYEDGNVTPVAPTGNWTIEGADDFIVFPRNYASTNDELKAAIAAGTDRVILADGNYELYGLNFKANNVTLKGVDKANVVLNLEQSIYLQNKSVTLENLTYNLNAGKNYTEQAFAYVHHATAFNLKNCNVNRLRLNVYEANIEDCTFTLNTSSGFDGYCIYYYGNDNSTVNVKNSSFATAGKGICIYSESAKAYNLNVDKCSFTSSDSATDKAAIQMHTELGIFGNVKITETTATGFANINGGLWNELNNNTKVATDKFDIWVDGTQVH